MGHNIFYEGIVKVDKPFDDATYQLIMNLAKSRRMIWNTQLLEKDGVAKKSEIGFEGEFFFPVFSNVKERDEFEDKYVLEPNFPPGGQPDLYGIWVVTEDKMGLIWSRKEKSYRGHEWLQYLVKKILIPRGYKPYGIVNWFAEWNYPQRKFHSIVEGHKVVKKRGYHKTVNEPDIDAWYDEKIASYQESHQNWVSMIVENQVQFLHKNTFQKTLSFNVYINKDIIQATLKEHEIISCNYLYRNVRKEEEKWNHEEDFKNKVQNEFLLNKVKEIILAYIQKYPNFLNEAIL
ncbi:hypothetical protein CVD28_01910 [Bacillus sp. M6-12]|uniref:hypothetical protein n=1 Tax=Bacillus sp. M6-12 TaxID=2054166 RepID=UPI000C786B50|nr:hypothetical protein [Bacillus sp. M6-12]PLS19187.1 hypothetical protein CVD28_01910 [Bacillus sp. M6-12]